MGAFARPAVWSYDLGLFRASTGDEQRLEAMLAAIAVKDEGLWVAELDERPAAFAWTLLVEEQATVRLLELFVQVGTPPALVLGPLLQRIAQEIGTSACGMRAHTGSIHGIDDATMQAAGFDRDGDGWKRPLGLFSVA